jgi:hypothetical protein
MTRWSGNERRLERESSEEELGQPEAADRGFVRKRDGERGWRCQKAKQHGEKIVGLFDAIGTVSEDKIDRSFQKHPISDKSPINSEKVGRSGKKKKKIYIFPLL